MVRAVRAVSQRRCCGDAVRALPARGDDLPALASTIGRAVIHEPPTFEQVRLCVRRPDLVLHHVPKHLR